MDGFFLTNITHDEHFAHFYLVEVMSWIYLLTSSFLSNCSQGHTLPSCRGVGVCVNIWAWQRSREAKGSRISYSPRHVGLISRTWPLLSCHHVIGGQGWADIFWIWGHIWVEPLCGLTAGHNGRSVYPMLCMRLRVHGRFTCTIL